MKILILAPYPLKEAPSQRFRFELFLKFMEHNSIKWDFQPFVLADEWKILYQKKKNADKLIGVFKGFLRRFKMLFKAKKYDFIFLHREATPLGPPIFEWIIAKILKKKIIYDFDDAIWLPDQQENLIWKWLKWRSKVKSICKWSWKVSAGNEYLADFARGYCKQVQVLPTVVDMEVHTPLSPLKGGDRGDRGVSKSQKPKVKVQKPVIGWTGSHSTLFYLNEIIPVLQELEKEYDFEFLVIANRDPQLPLKNFRFVPWNKESEIEDLNQIDIGIMPLQDNEWAKGKCGFKLIQYLALGKPAVASPVGVNPEIIINNETGFLATSKDEWLESLKRLIENPDLRRELGENGRKLIETRYSVESQRKQFLGLFHSV